MHSEKIMESTLTIDPVFVRIDGLLKEQGRQQKDLINHLSMAHNTYVHWRNQKNRSYLKHINEIAEFFGVSPNYLLRGEEASEHHSIYEEEFLRFFRKLNEKNTKLVFELVKTISETQT